MNVAEGKFHGTTLVVYINERKKLIFFRIKLKEEKMLIKLFGFQKKRYIMVLQIVFFIALIRLQSH